MTRRLYLAPCIAAAESDGQLRLPKDAAHYLRTVLRLTTKDNVEVFTGDGRTSLAQVAQITKQHVALDLGDWVQHATPKHQLNLACAVLKNQAMDRVVQKATELGASAIHPLYTQHTQVPNAARKNPQARLSHWQRIVENAAEQCGQNFLPTLHTPIPLADFLNHKTQALDQVQDQVQDEVQALVLAIGAPSFPRSLASAPTLIMSGPEGGWSEQEMMQLQEHKVVPASFGELILRAETAPLVGLVSARQALP